MDAVHPTVGGGDNGGTRIAAKIHAGMRVLTVTTADAGKRRPFRQYGNAGTLQRASG